ncbi:unnamed protein product [Linum tenue]|uniref:Uncharacterized protein n=1 Tax=Linum tenue TaxID=586396 RepID=A0AAV0IGU8_9ROSI|nr:unnamed protein product [Linum tenue]
MTAGVATAEKGIVTIALILLFLGSVIVLLNVEGEKKYPLSISFTNKTNVISNNIYGNW